MSLIERFEELIRENERLKMEISALKSGMELQDILLQIFSELSESSDKSEE